jgi:hypothetical protein
MNVFRHSHYETCPGQGDFIAGQQDLENLQLQLYQGRNNCHLFHLLKFSLSVMWCGTASVIVMTSSTPERNQKDG